MNVVSGIVTDRLDWTRDGSDWPNRDASRFVTSGGVRWHVQMMGAAGAPAVLLVHGTGASTHSFRDLMPLLSDAFHVVTFDLPGHGFTTISSRTALSLQGMAAEISILLKKLDVSPIIAVGHSAGAAILIEMALKRYIAPRRIIGINSALQPMQGHAFFSPMAKLMFMNPLVPRLMSWRARYGDGATRVLSMTGSRIGPDGVRYYQRLLESPGHVSGALGMMASWDLEAILEQLPNLKIPLTLVVAQDDAMVPASVSRNAAKRVPGAELITIPHGGHLLHEVDPQAIATIIRERAGG